jgi:hypothetical protein
MVGAAAPPAANEVLAAPLGSIVDPDKLRHLETPDLTIEVRYINIRV